ncbi:MAG: transglycosylase SLT domain-containing protein [Dehalococcoidia bacterium]
MSNYTTLASFQVDTAILAIVDRHADANGVPRNVVRAIVLAESGMNPGAVGDGGWSPGLLQLYRNGGQGDGYTHEQLLDPETNMRVGMVAIRDAWTRTAALQGAERVRRTAGLSGHPRDPQALDHGYPREQVEASIERIVGIWQQLESDDPQAAPAQFAGLVPIVDAGTINDTLDRGAAWLREHRAEAVVAAGAALAAMLLA